MSSLEDLVRNAIFADLGPWPGHQPRAFVNIYLARVSYDYLPASKDFQIPLIWGLRPDYARQ